MSRSDVDHYEGLTYWGPLSVARMEHVLTLLDLPAGAAALDVGCGRGELLVRLAERRAVRATAVDRSEAALALVRQAFAARCPELAPVCVASDASALRLDEGAFDLVIWLGGPYIGPSFETTVAALRAWTRPGGTLLIGHGFWASPPPEDYLSATGIDAAELCAHRENLLGFERADLTLLYTCTSSRDEWDAFEGRILYNQERHAEAHPDAPGVAEMIARKRAWNLAQQRWGRDVMGFGLYLLRKP